ncbi:MAG: septum formation initiator family protein [Chitinophagaceae bacterium]|jgi:cell division protein DivIC|nr:septum formation initiator family protein [Chitinophagaceae bacterium]
MKFLTHIPSVLKNKYLLTIIGFTIWMLFIDRNDFLTQIGRYQKLSELKTNTSYYNKKIDAAKTELEKRKSDPSAYERIAREKYYMKKDNEDIFLFNE